ncbi:MAG: hypothetical protein R3D68_07095 [Hyphomicrobiaceae bacterium]
MSDEESGKPKKKRVRKIRRFTDSSERGLYLQRRRRRKDRERHRVCTALGLPVIKNPTRVTHGKIAAAARTRITPRRKKWTTKPPSTTPMKLHDCIATLVSGKHRELPPRISRILINRVVKAIRSRLCWVAIAKEMVERRLVGRPTEAAKYFGCSPSKILTAYRYAHHIGEVPAPYYANSLTAFSKPPEPRREPRASLVLNLQQLENLRSILGGIDVNETGVTP